MISDERLAILEGFSSQDVMDLCAEVRANRRVLGRLRYEHSVAVADDCTECGRSWPCLTRLLVDEALDEGSGDA